MPWLAVLGMAGAFFNLGRPDGAALILLSFHCFLRTAELLGVCRHHVTWTRARRRGVLLLPLTKSGQRHGCAENVTFDDELVGEWLHDVLTSRGMFDAVWTGSSQSFRKLWKHCLGLCGLPAIYQPYSLRRGGATHHFLEHSNLTLTQYRGRWAAQKTCRIYVVEGQRELCEVALTADAKARCTAMALLLKGM